MSPQNIDGEVFETFVSRGKDVLFKIPSDLSKSPLTGEYTDLIGHPVAAATTAHTDENAWFSAACWHAS